MNFRSVKISALSIGIAFSVGVVANWFIRLIDFFTNLAFYQRLSFQRVSPSDHHLGLYVILVPVIGGLIVGIMARYGSAAIRGHGIPEAMEQILFNQSRISPRVAVLKPLSAGIAIGTGGPFGAEGPIIATGGAFGSLVGQFMSITAVERKTLLAAGAAAGMTAVFGSPVAAVLLAIELLLFEFRAASIVPVALAAVTANAVRIFFAGSAPFAPGPMMDQPTNIALACYVCMGAVFGLMSVWITKLLYLIEDGFELVPIHWMWWPAIGSLAVGIVGYFDPRTLGIGYQNIDNILHGSMTLNVILMLGILKLVSWSISLASGTSGGTLAPLFTIGGAFGGALGMIVARLWPGSGVDPRVAALVGMAAVFTGASRAFLASVVFAFEITRQPLGLLPLLGSCAASYLVSGLLMKTSIMTEKITRRGFKVPTDYVPDFLDHVFIKAIASKHLVVLQSKDTVEKVRSWILSGVPGSSHQGFPVLSGNGELAGVLTLRNLMRPDVSPAARIDTLIERPPVVVYENQTGREAMDLMVRERIGRLPVLSEQEPHVLKAMITRSDLLAAHERRIEEHQHKQRILTLRLEDIYRRFAKREQPR